MLQRLGLELIVERGVGGSSTSTGGKVGLQAREDERPVPVARYFPSGLRFINVAEAGRLRGRHAQGRLGPHGHADLFIDARFVRPRRGGRVILC